MAGLQARVGTTFDKAAAEAVLPVAGLRLAAECRPISYFTDIEPLLAGLEGNPFQSIPVLSAWFSTFAGRGNARECFLVILRNMQGQAVLALPLTRNRIGGLTRLELPDSGVIDFTTPFLLRSYRPFLPPPEALWDLIAEVLPEADVAVFRRMAPGVSGLCNPLFAHPLAQPSPFVSWRAEDIGDMTTHLAALARPFRKKLRRNREKFMELPGARVLAPESAAEALPILEAMEAMQGERIRGRGWSYGLDCPRVKSFYRRLIEQGIERGHTQITALEAEGRIVAAGLAIVSHGEAIYLRVASDFGEHGALTPGLLVTDSAMRQASACGISVFDFGMGSYPFKRQMRARPSPLRDLIVPLSGLGYAAATLLRLRLAASTSRALRRLMGKDEIPSADDES